MRVSPKYVTLSRESKEQQVSLSCFLDSGNDITNKCKFILEDDNSDITIVKNIIKTNKKPKASINKILVLYEKDKYIEQDFAIIYID